MQYYEKHTWSRFFQIGKCEMHKRNCDVETFMLTFSGMMFTQGKLLAKSLHVVRLPVYMFFGLKNAVCYPSLFLRFQMAFLLSSTTI